jgi:glc operon protein GlcG
MSITHQQAQSALNASIAKAEEMGVTVAIAVVDDHADLVALMRMGSSRFLFLPQAAQGKAMATVVWRGQLSGALTERAGTPMMQAVNKTYGDRLFYQQGAVPIKRGDQVIGAVGVGGASPQQDEEIAIAGASAIAD